METASKCISEIIKDIESLTQEKGYIYSLSLILYNDFHIALDNLHLINPRTRLSVKEASFIVAQLIKHQISLDYPESPNSFFTMKERTYTLMGELHRALNEPTWIKMRDALQEYDETGNLQLPSQKEMFVDDNAMVEPIFYSGDGAYDIQYLELLPKKYEFDAEWLRTNKGFVTIEVIDIIDNLKASLTSKAREACLLDYRTDAEISKIFKANSSCENDALANRFIELLQFYNLFPTEPKNDVLLPEEEWYGYGERDWHIFYDNLFDLSLFSKEDIKDMPGASAFLKNFCLDLSSTEIQLCNNVGDFNIYCSRPIIPLHNNSFWIPIFYLLPQAVFEAPFYWMAEDASYKSQAMHNRGEVGESLVYDYLLPVFGERNLFKSIKIKANKTRTITDIDILGIVGSKALCVQVKSKKLTQKSRGGNSESIVRDFKASFQAAYEQGLICREKLLSQKCIFCDRNDKRLELPSSINEVYIMCLTTENYPALVHMAHLLLEKKDDDPYPLPISIFDLELVAHYLKDKYDFMYYVRQRIETMDYFHGAEEAIFLGYHLDQKLWRNPKYTQMMLDTDFGGLVDRNYYPYKLGLSDKISDDSDALAHTWRNDDFNRLCNEIKSSNNPNKTDVIFVLLDLNSSTRDKLIELIETTKSKSRDDGSKHSFFMGLDGKSGISFVSTGLNAIHPVGEEAYTYASLRKYMSKADNWIGIGTHGWSPYMADCIMMDTTPWTYDSEMEELVDDFHKRKKSSVLKRTSSEEYRPAKIGRNDKCPCGSGLKYKKCCGKYNS